MRLRSLTLYNEEEFDEFFSNLNANSNIIEENLEEDSNSNISDEFDDLRCDSSYQLKEIPKTLKELEKIDEENLLNSIEKMNEELNILNNKKQKEVFYIGFDNKNEKSSNSVNYNVSDKNLDQNLNDSNENNSNLSLTTNIENSIDLNVNNFDYDYFIIQNLKCFDEKIKIIVIGEQKVGKSFFLNQIGVYDDFKKKCNFNINEYNPTECLEICKSYVTVEKKLIKIESFDTNIKIINSKIIETYYKLCDGYIFVACTDNNNSLNFIENQFKKLLNFNYNNLDKILFIVNEKIKSNFEFINKLKNIYIKYNENIDNLNFISIDLKNFNYSNLNFQKFLKNIISIKSCKNYDSNFFNHITDKNIETILSERKEKIKEYISEKRYLLV